MTSLLKWLVPGGVVLALALALVHGFGPEAVGSGISSGILLGVAAAVAFVAAYFHRSRLVLFALGLGAILLMAPPGDGVDPGLLLLGGFQAFLMGVLVLFQDRGVLSTPVLVQAVILLAGLALAWLVVDLAPEEIAVLLAAAPLPEEWTVWSGMPQPVFLAVLTSLGLAFTVAAIRRGPVEKGVFWSLALLGMALRSASDPESAGIFLLGACLTLGLSVMETSYAMAYKDDLTGLPARRALMRDLQALGSTYSAAMVDVDHFKRFNDRYGHDVGDQVLRMVAGRLAKGPGGSRAYRYGGEEFTLLYPGKTLKEALVHAKAVRRSVEDAMFALRSWRRPRKKPVDPGAWRGRGTGSPKKLSVTVSIGIADSTGPDSSPESVLKRADRALYKAKRGGRNRVST
jgi:GGDEF domain-containing protein